MPFVRSWFCFGRFISYLSFRLFWCFRFSGFARFVWLFQWFRFVLVVLFRCFVFCRSTRSIESNNKASYLFVKEKTVWRLPVPCKNALSTGQWGTHCKISPAKRCSPQKTASRHFELLRPSRNAFRWDTLPSISIFINCSDRTIKRMLEKQNHLTLTI